jgi:hypothetical protein
MEKRDKDVAAFLKTVRETATLWRSIDFRTVAVQLDGTWHNLAAHCRLRTEPPGDVLRVEHLPRTSELIAVQEVWPIDHLPALLDALVDGQIEAGGYTLRLVHGVRPADESYQSTSFTPERKVDLRDADPYGTAHELMLTGDGMREIFDRIPGGRDALDVLLRGLDRPWHGLDGLTLYGIMSPHGSSGTHSRYVQIVAPLEATFAEPECVLSDGVLHFTALAGSREVRGEVSLAVAGHGRKERIISELIPLGRRRWTRHADGYRYAGKQRLPGAKMVTLMLRVAGRTAAQLTLHDRTGVPPLLLAAYGALFPRTDQFRDHLLSPRPNSRKFERAVTRLLVLCGFLVDPLDLESETEAPDALAYAPAHGLLLVLECTVSALNKEGKLARFVQRTSAVRTATSGRDVRVLPLMVTVLLRDALSASELSEAEKDGIRVLCHEDLAALHALALAHAPVEDAIRVIEPRPRSVWETLGRNPLLD